MMMFRSTLPMALWAFGFASADGAILLDNWGTSTTEQTVASLKAPHLRLFRFTTPNFATQLQSLRTRLAVSTASGGSVTCEIRTDVSTNGGTVVHTMTCPPLIFGAIRSYTFTTTGFTFQPNTTYGISIRGNTGTITAGSWFGAVPMVAPTGLATFLDTRITTNGTTFTTDVLYPRITLLVNDPDQTINGALVLNDTSSEFAAPRTMSYIVKQGTTTLQSGTIVATTPTTSFGITAPSTATGPATIIVDGSSFVQKTFSINLSGTTTDIGTLALTNGDPDLSGEVDAADIDMAILAFGSTVSTDTDVDCSGEIDAADIDIIIANFGAVDN